MSEKILERFEKAFQFSVLNKAVLKASPISYYKGCSKRSSVPCFDTLIQLS